MPKFLPFLQTFVFLSLSLLLPFYMKIRYNIFVRLLKNAHGPTIVNPFTRTDFKIVPDNYGLYAYIYIRIIFHVFFLFLANLQCFTVVIWCHFKTIAPRELSNFHSFNFSIFVVIIKWERVESESIMIESKL